MAIDPEAVMPWVKVAGDALSALKRALDLMPKGKPRDEAVQKIEEAETALKVAEAQVAREFGYPLCKKHWPPGIMLAKGDDSFQCPECDAVETASARTRALEEIEVRLLRVLAEMPAEEGWQHWIGTDEELSRRVEVSETRGQYYLSRLRTEGYIQRYSGIPHYYQLLQKGREALVVRNLV